MKCAACGAPNPPIAEACTECGAPLSEPDALREVSLRCPECGEMAEGGAAVCSFCQAPMGKPRKQAHKAASDPSAGRDLQMEAHVSAIALLYRITALLGGVVCLMLLISTVAAGERMWARMSGILIILMVVIAVIGLLVYALGHFLGKFSNAARIIAMILGLVGLVGNIFSIGLAIITGMDPRVTGMPPLPLTILMHVLSMGWGVAILWALYNSRAASLCTETYIQRVASSPDVKPPTFASPFFWLPFILVGVSIVVAICIAADSAPSYRRW